MLLCGAGGRIRTRDPRITSAVLYQLSYTGIGEGVFSVHSLDRTFTF